MKTDMHGLEMIGLKKASGETKDLQRYDNWTLQIAYNRASGEVITSPHVGSGWTEYNDGDIITICHADRPMTMRDIADAIAIRLRFPDRPMTMQELADAIASARSNGLTIG